ncbi:MAG: cadherin-like beta sandwich domain-containing protein [Chitinispirillales bacterium]|jgi:predicted outer membrane repeat protein|nr:cadherin-like beta sandwich domain-containing protein [Chitinispirillales bacterium]
MFKLTLKALFTLITLFSIVNAQYAVRVYSKHESIQELNVSRPRIFVENTGTETIRDFYYYYYFTVENGKVPTVERYYAPNCYVNIEDLGNGDYRVKYDYRNVNFNPGDILPDVQGNVIGLRYLDWSSWDKSNDYSFDNSSEFRQNGKIPVFLADGTQIYGSSLPDPEIPPLPPEIKHSNSQYAVFSTEYTDLRDRSTVNGGIVGSAVYTEVGCDAVVNGELLSGGDIFLRERAKINGDAAAKQEIKKQNNTVITGTERSFAEINFPQIVSHQINPGTWDVVIGPNGSGTVNPGSYREIVVYANSSVTFKTGIYEVDRLIVEPDVKLVFESQIGNKTDIRIKSEGRFGDRTKFQFIGDTIPLAVSIYSEQSSQFRIGTDAVIYGQITAPNASVVVNSRTAVYGMIMGKQVIIEPQGVVCKPAALEDFWHSEWAYTPSFDPLSFEYKAVVSNNTGALRFVPYIPQGAQVFVNGNSYVNDSSVSIALSGSSTDITVEVKDPQNCGKTVYVINVQKSPDYRIFVNEKSPALAGQENGNSWQSAYKCLQKAIDASEREGKEIWVAEGTYYPVYQTNSDDPRSATFLIKPGIEIIGGFNGDETEREPKGSPYNTILSGDLAKNDGTAWPVSEDKLTDNAYHVVTMSGNGSVGELKLKRVTISGGAANGAGENSIGGGILNVNCAPTLMYTIISRNMATSSGAGIMDRGGIKRLENCLIKNNISIRSSGAGLYTTNGHFQIDASVFDGNILQDTMNQTGGGALYVGKEAKLNMVNSIFTRNKATKNGGAIYNDNGIILIENSAFSSNIAANGQSISNEGGSVTIKNSILWNNEGKQEINGDAASVSYTCITGGYAGIGNISQNPNFVNANSPAGSDGIYGTVDDGLQLMSNSPCINAGGESNVGYDIRLMPRPQGNKVDLGAYEYNTYANEGAFLGILRSGQFIEMQGFRVLPFILETKDIPLFAKSNLGRVLRMKVPKNDHTKNRTSGYVLARWKNNDGTSLSGSDDVKINMYKVYEEGKNMYFQSNKRVLFVADGQFQGEHTDTYIIMAGEDGFLNLTVPHNQ